MVTAQNYRISEISRFLIVIGGMCASFCISTFYGFNILSNKMVELFNFSSADLTTITTVGVVVCYATFPGGMLLDYAGPLPVLIFSTVMNVVGVILYGLAFQGVITGSVVKFSVFSAIMSLGCSHFDTGSLMAILGNFPTAKGPVVILTKTFAGLGASILAVINYSFFRTAYANYMYFMAAVVLFMGITACVFIRFPPYHLVDRERTHVPEETQVRRRLTERAYLTQRPPMRRFFLGFVLIVALVIFLAVQSLCVAYANPSDKARMGNTIVIIILVFSFGLMAAPLPFLGGMEVEPSKELPEMLGPHVEESAEKHAVAVEGREAVHDENALDELYVGDSSYKAKKLSSSGSEDSEVMGGDGVAVDDEVLLEDENLALMLISDQDPQYQTTFLQSIRNVDIWLCCFTTLATWGCGIVMNFNSAQIYRALADDDYETKTNTMYSALISVGSALGRISMGIFEYYLSQQSSNSRLVITTAYPVAPICMVIGLIFLLALPLNSKAIVIGFVLDSFGNGFSWASTALTIRTVFAKDIGKHYNFMYAGAFFAVIALNRFGYGELYDREAKRQREAAIAAGTTNIYPRCAGKKCVDYSMIILLCVNATAIVASSVLHYRYRRFVLKHRAEKAVELEAHRQAHQHEPKHAEEVEGAAAAPFGHTV